MSVGITHSATDGICIERRVCELEAGRIIRGYRECVLFVLENHLGKERTNVLREHKIYNKRNSKLEMWIQLKISPTSYLSVVSQTRHGIETFVSAVDIFG